MGERAPAPPNPAFEPTLAAVPSVESWYNSPAARAAQRPIRYAPMLPGIITVLAAVMATMPKAESASERALAALAATQPSLEWHQDIRVDVDCDGSLDDVFTARDAVHFYVAAVLGGRPAKPKVSVVSFSLRGDSQSSFCGDPSPLEKESMDYDPTEMLGEIPQGFRRSKRCFGIHLVAGECDSFHFFWNHSTQELDWWRL